ncbi:MAG: galactose mutarotase [Duncaniella sp.]|nr:galactose mutarotase [Duncaniella sp.]
MRPFTLVFPPTDGLPEVRYHILTNSGGASVMLSSLGAGIVGIWVPDRDGKLADVVLGYKDHKSYLADGPCAGKVPGRFANRIAHGRFVIDGREYHLAINNGPNALHGGPTGFQNRVWESRLTANGGIEFSYFSADGEEGYPGNLCVKALYTWDDDNRLTLRLTAQTDAPTVVNLTNHTYFNLDGEGAGSVLNHRLLLNASHFLPTDDTLIPTGELAPVASTPMDFTSSKPLGQDINADFEPLKFGKGYDHCFAIDGYRKGAMRHAATLHSPLSGRTLEVSTTQPGVQLYTGNWLQGCPESISGGEYADYSAVALECQGFPDAPNKPDFPSALLRPGETFDETIEFKFS